MKGDDYMRGRHFWTHFWCGLVIGGIFGTRICWGLFANPAAAIGCAVGIAVIFACAVGYWGDPLWRKLIELWAWLKF